MNTLDKLFSREIERRTGAHAISIYIDSVDPSKKRQKRSRSRNSSRTKPQSSDKTSITTIKSKHSFLYRINVRFPWLKLFIVLIIGTVAILDLCDLTISRLREPTAAPIATPMSRHVRATERVLEGKKLVALTFDDGPSAETTPRLLEILEQKDVRATFFMLGYMARNNPDIVKQVENNWHEVASHTMYHQNLIRIPESASQADIDESNAIFESILGHKPTLTHPPYGNSNSTIRKQIGTPIILWSVDTLDWKNKDVNSIVATTMSQVSDGAIILMHDIHPTSVDAIPTLVDALRNEGYEFATISELTKMHGAILSAGEVYYNL